MTSEPLKKLEEARKKITEAVPEIMDADAGFLNVSGIGWQYSYVNEYGINHHSEDIFPSQKEAHEAAIMSGKFPSRPIRLTDVLLGIEQEKGYGDMFTMDSDGSMCFYRVNLLAGPEPENETLKAGWNLREDDLSLQSEETVAFIHSILCK